MTSLKSIWLAAAACAPAMISLACATTNVLAQAAPPPPPPLELPKPPPAQVSSSEGTAPLPLPATFQKRQERKNPPQPPVLITKIRTADNDDWARTPNDLKGLLEWMSAQMNVHFSSNIKTFDQVPEDAKNMPILYRSGYKAFDLTPEEIQRLHSYLLNGGTIIFNTLVGNPAFYQSALKAAHEILPERNVYRLRMDHPVFNSYYPITQVKYRDRAVKDGVVSDSLPFLEGVDIDDRTAIFISRWDFSMGWEKNPADSWGYADEDARRIGGNIVAYVTAMRDAGKSVGKSVELVDADKKTADKVRVGQVIHAGPWKTRTAAFPMLLNQFHLLTGAPVSFDLADVRLTDPAIFDMPILYLTGTTDFQLTDAERADLRQFLLKGGVLFAEAADGRASFDAGFRAEMAKVLPNEPLTQLPANHPIFTRPMNLAMVKARPALAVKRGNQTEEAPEIYGINVNGALGVIYSPNDLSAGWERAVDPYAIGYEPADATALGVSALFYAVTH
jgi:hypothetical protein